MAQYDLYALVNSLEITLNDSMALHRYAQTSLTVFSFPPATELRNIFTQTQCNKNLKPERIGLRNKWIMVNQRTIRKSVKKLTKLGKKDVEIKVHEIKTILRFIKKKPLQSASCIMLLLLVGQNKCIGINFMLFLKEKPRMCIN